MKTVRSTFLKAFLMILIMTLLCGVLYTGVITGVAQAIFPHAANGSIIEVDGKKYGSELLGQQYKGDNHMWGRIMKIDTKTFVDENGTPLAYSSAENISPKSKEYEELVSKRVEKIKAAHPEKGNTPIPSDLVTCSGSGLDPHISVAAANYQVSRLSKNTNKSEDEVKSIVDKCTNRKFLGVFGEDNVNVLKVNLMLDGILK